MSENEIRVLYVQPGKYPEERTIPNTLRALQELVGGDIECCRPWRDSVCVICNDSGKIDGLPPNRLYGHTDFLAGSFVVCGNGGEDFISLTDRQVFLYERLYHIECNLLCVVTKRLAKKAERVYKSMKATGVRYLQFIPCLDPLGEQRGIESYSLSPELYAQFLCALFDAWYRDWKTGVYVSVRLFEDYIQLLMGAPTGTCSTTGACGSYMVVEGSGAVYPCDFYCLDEYKLGTIQNDSLQSLLLGEKMRIFIKDGRNVPAECQQCRWVNLCHGGCKRDRNTADKAQRSYYCKALQKFFAYAEPRMREMARAVQMYR